MWYFLSFYLNIIFVNNIGYYDIGLTDCDKCHYSCATCSGGSDADCTSCNNFDFRNFNPNISSCTCDNSRIKILKKMNKYYLI